jgi:pimeloyl-ACP methyl ester carboxylesterase
VASLLTAVLGAGVVTGVPAVAAAAPAPPAEDPFYQPPPGFETTAPGTLLRSRQVTVTGLGVPFPVSAWQSLARSTGADGRAVAVASTLMVPLTPYPQGKRPLLSYQTAIDSLGDQCNPSYTLRAGTEKELGLMSLGLMRGWAVVVTDFEGPRNAFAAGTMAGHAVLDGIRAVEKLPGTGLSGAATPVGLMGYSGGGQATSWAAELQPGYAAELAVKGVASGGTPADLRGAERQMDGGPFAGLAIAAVAGIVREYPQLLTLVNAAGVAMLERIKDMCVAEVTTANAFRRLAEFTTSADPLNEPVAADVLNRNDLGQRTPGVPVYLYHSFLDELIPYAGVQNLRRTWCRGGARVQFYTDFLSEHTVLAGTGAPAAVSYLDDRFAGRPAPSNCQGMPDGSSRG